MKAKNIMTTKVFTVGPDATVREIASMMAQHGISAVPVLDHHQVVGIVTEGDLLHRQEIGTERYRTRMSWVRFLEDEKALAAIDAKEHGMRARDIMTKNVICITEDTPIAEIADTLERNNIKRLLVLNGTKLVGIVSRANIVRAIAARPEGALEPSSSDDDEIRFRVIETLQQMKGTSPWLTTVVVVNGVVFLYGTVEDETVRDPSRLAIEKIPYVVEVRDHRGILQPY